MPIEMNELFGIAGKVAVITGAGGVLGGNIAKHFMRQGAKVVAVDIRQEQLDKRVPELKQYGNEVIGIVGDVLGGKPGKTGRTSTFSMGED
jgi:NAD(P)-dependent dehydrogenase (short-subunit alcohol dehydrogenase family)